MNNRQAGRRRGRGGQRSQGGNPNNQGNGNRIDNRARGNAAQLLEKYKNLARDAQMQGDRVNTEYYLQFADHYFRVLSENRSRFEEQNQRQQRIESDDEDFEFEGEVAAEPRVAESRGERQQAPREDRPSRHGNGANGHANGEYHQAEQIEEAEEATPVREPAPRRGRRRREEAPAVEADAETQGIDAAVLPPSFGATAANDEAEAEAEPKPRRRRRTARADDAEAPPAA